MFRTYIWHSMNLLCFAFVCQSTVCVCVFCNWLRTVIWVGGNAVGLAVLLQAKLLLVQVYWRGVDAAPLQVQTYPLAPLPPCGRQRYDNKLGKWREGFRINPRLLISTPVPGNSNSVGHYFNIMPLLGRGSADCTCHPRHYNLSRGNTVPSRVVMTLEY